jgi:hypothetical protein
MDRKHAQHPTFGKRNPERIPNNIMQQRLMEQYEAEHGVPEVGVTGTTEETHTQDNTNYNIDAAITDETPEYNGSITDEVRALFHEAQNCAGIAPVNYGRRKMIRPAAEDTAVFIPNGDGIGTIVNAVPEDDLRMILDNAKEPVEGYVLYEM